MICNTENTDILANLKCHQNHNHQVGVTLLITGRLKVGYKEISNHEGQIQKSLKKKYHQCIQLHQTFELIFTIRRTGIHVKIQYNT